MDPSRPTRGFLYNVAYMFDVTDLMSDMGEAVGDNISVTAAHVTTYSILAAQVGMKTLLVK